MTNDFLPRIHFKGEFVCNSATGNNDDILTKFIEHDTVTLTPEVRSMSDAEARALLGELVTVTLPGSENTMEFINAGWNWYGDMTTYFRDAQITAVRGTDGQTTTGDPLVGKFVNIIGEAGNLPVITMPDPINGGSQIFVGGVTIGDSGTPNAPTDLAMRADDNTRCFSQWILDRNAGTSKNGLAFAPLGAIWQFAVPKAALTDVDPPAGSVLTDLVSAAMQEDGLLVQFACYQMKPVWTAAQLHAKFEAGEFIANPAVGRLVGSILVRRQGDLATIINGRRLVKMPMEPNPPWSGVGAATVDTKHKVVTLNMITMVPEDGFPKKPPAQARPQKKLDLGTLVLAVIPPHGLGLEGPIEIATMTYDERPGEKSYGYDAYVREGGIVDLQYDGKLISDEIIQQGQLIVYSAQPVLADPDAWYCESDIRIETDDVALYLHAGEAKPIDVVVTGRNLAPGEEVTVYCWEYQWTLAQPGLRDRPRQLTSAPFRVGGALPLTPHLEPIAPVRVQAGVRTTIQVTGSSPGPSLLVFTETDVPLQGGNDFPCATAFVLPTRVLPDDDYSGVPRETRVSWKFMYDEVFRYYALIFPAMSQHILNFDSKVIMQQAAAAFVARSEPGIWGSTLYMPRTRALSTGKRELIREWGESLG